MLPSSFISSIKWLAQLAAASLPSRVPNGSSLILAYHNIVPPGLVGHGDASLHLSADQFAAQLRVVTEEADLVGLPTLLREHGRPGRRVAITFDDAYRGCVTFGLSACASAGVSPTVFVAPGLLGCYTPWDIWAQAGMWSAADRTEFLEAMRGDAARHATAADATLPECYQIASMEELRAAVHAFGPGLANHTWSHVNLAAIDGEDIDSEVEQAGRFLTEHFDQWQQPYLAYPYGLAPRAEAGLPAGLPIEAGLLVSGGWALPSRPLRGAAVPRLNVPAGLSGPAFKAKLRGRLGVGLA